MFLSEPCRAGKLAQWIVLTHDSIAVSAGYDALVVSNSGELANAMAPSSRIAVSAMRRPSGRPGFRRATRRGLRVVAGGPSVCHAWSSGCCRGSGTWSIKSTRGRAGVEPSAHRYLLLLFSSSSSSSQKSAARWQNICSFAGCPVSLPAGVRMIPARGARWQLRETQQAGAVLIFSRIFEDVVRSSIDRRGAHALEAIRRLHASRSYATTDQMTDLAPAS